MFIGQTANTSPTHVFTVATALTGGAFTAVTLGENGVKTCAAGEVPIGILTAETELPQAVGEDVNVQILGGAKWIAGAALKAGDLLAAGADGKAIKATSGAFVFAQALSAAAVGEAAEVLIIRGGNA